MHRSIAFVAFLALSWSQLVALCCDMGEGMAGQSATVAEAHPPATTPHAHHPAPTGDTPPAPPLPNHGGSHACLMIMACGFASVRQARPTAMIRLPAVFFAAAFPTPPIPVAADLAVETPPPRHTV